MRNVEGNESFVGLESRPRRGPDDHMEPASGRIEEDEASPSGCGPIRRREVGQRKRTHQRETRFTVELDASVSIRIGAAARVVDEGHDGSFVRVIEVPDHGRYR